MTWQNLATPMVDSPSASLGQCSATVDDVLGGDIAVSYLLAGGHDRIGYIAGPRSLRQVAGRHAGAVRAMIRAGRSPEDLTVIRAASPSVAAGL